MVNTTPLSGIASLNTPLSQKPRRGYLMVETIAVADLAGRTGKAAGEQRARVICLALAQALGLEIENG